MAFDGGSEVLAIHVYGHMGQHGNELVDKLAKSFVTQATPQLLDTTAELFSHWSDLLASTPWLPLRITVSTYRCTNTKK